MKPLNYYAVTGQVAAQHLVELKKLEVTLNANVTAGLFLQVHNSAVVPAEGAVPIKVWPAAETGYKEFKRGELTLALGCYICLSSTAGTKTLALGANDKCDILEVEFNDPEVQADSSYAGDLTTPVTSLVVWNDAAGPKNLRVLEVDGTNLTTVCYLQFFPADNPVNGNVPVKQLTIAAGAVRTGAAAYRFGEEGVSLVAGNASGNHKGCTIAISTTPGLLTLTADNAKMKAEYHN